MLTTDNDRFWDSEKRARGYATRSYLDPVEARFIEEFRDSMRNWRMLDLGIGGGRSTIHFAPLVMDYVGTEYSETMLKECEARFDGSEPLSPSCHLLQADARDLKAFADADFDFALFSFNGLDEVDHQGRLQALAEIHRVLKPGGVFFFSSHNLLAIDQIFRFRFTRHPLRLIRNAWRYLRVRMANRGLAKADAPEGWTRIHDYAYDWSKFAYFVTPHAQLAQLAACEFEGAQVYLENGPAEVDNDALSTKVWLHYLCRASSAR